MTPAHEDPPGFLPPGGNYREFLSFRKSEAIFDFTFRFTEKCFRLGDRTVDQMVQSARSGKQNIAEGCKASATSSEMELKLVNVVRASLEEMLLDYQDYLLDRQLRRLERDFVQKRGIRERMSRARREYRLGGEAIGLTGPIGPIFCDTAAS
jgi:four helix bundle suffix protein